MKAVLCPVCNGIGKVAPTSSWCAADNLVTCHGCAGKGWVAVHEEYPYCYPSTLPSLYQGETVTISPQESS